jgi:hypothetical protein
VEVSTSVKGSVVHQAVVEEVVEQIILIAYFRRVKHIGWMELVHVLEVVLGGARGK